MNITRIGLMITLLPFLMSLGVSAESGTWPIWVQDCYDGQTPITEGNRHEPHPDIYLNRVLFGRDQPLHACKAQGKDGCRDPQHYCSLRVGTWDCGANIQVDVLPAQGGKSIERILLRVSGSGSTLRYSSYSNDGHCQQWHFDQ
jgi:hypothetical protein